MKKLHTLHNYAAKLTNFVGRYIRTCVDMCKALDIYAAVMRNHGMEVWSSLFSFVETEGLSPQNQNLPCKRPPVTDIPEKSWHIFLVAKKAWNAIVSFWCMHYQLRDTERHESMHVNILLMTKYTIQNVLMDVKKNAQNDMVSKHCILERSAAAGFGNAMNMETGNDFGEDLAYCYASDDTDKYLHWMGTKSDGLEQSAVSSVLLPGWTVQTTLEKFLVVLDRLIRVQDKERSRSYARLSAKLESYKTLSRQRRMRSCKKRSREEMCSEDGCVLEECDDEMLALPWPTFTLQDINLIGLVTQGLGMPLWKQFVFECMVGNEDDREAACPLFPWDEVHHTDCGGGIKINWVDQYLANSFRSFSFSICHFVTHGCEPTVHDVMHGFYGHGMYGASKYTPSNGNQLSRLVFGLPAIQTVLHGSCSHMLPGMHTTFADHFLHSFQQVAVDKIASELFDVKTVLALDCVENAKNKLRGLSSNTHQGHQYDLQNPRLFLLPSLICILHNIENIASHQGKREVQRILNMREITKLLTDYPSKVATVIAFNALAKTDVKNDLKKDGKKDVKKDAEKHGEKDALNNAGNDAVNDDENDGKHKMQQQGDQACQNAAVTVLQKKIMENPEFNTEEMFAQEMEKLLVQLSERFCLVYTNVLRPTAIRAHLQSECDVAYDSIRGKFVHERERFNEKIVDVQHIQDLLQAKRDFVKAFVSFLFDFDGLVRMINEAISKTRLVAIEHMLQDRNTSYAR